MKEIKAQEGFYLTDKNKTSFYTSILGADINEADYIEISIEEANEIIAEQTAINQLSTMEDIDNVITMNNAIPQVINTLNLDDTEALKRKEHYPYWEANKVVYPQEKYQYDGKLWKVITQHTTQLGWEPSINTSSLWVVIDEEHQGTLEDPIPFIPPMEIFNNKYYIQNNIIYLCTRDSNIALTHDLNTLINIYVQTV